MIAKLCFNSHASLFQHVLTLAKLIVDVKTPYKRGASAQEHNLILKLLTESMLQALNILQEERMRIRR